VLWAIEAGAHPGSASDQEQMEVRRDLDQWHVRSVIVGPMDHQAQTVAFFTQILGRPPVAYGGVWLWSRL
jgi:hypothetical protein